jgi:hypothetical protein
MFQQGAIKQAWQKLGYQNKMAEWSLYALFLTGFLLWEALSVPWDVMRLLLVIHVLLSMLIFPIYVLPFWLSHRRLLKHSKRRFLNITGQCLDLILGVCVASGLYLFIQGNRGDELGHLVFLAHLVSALIFLPIIMRHSARWSVLQPLWSLIKSLRFPG